MSVNSISPLGKRAIEYIMERRCASGGFCFYRLDEPNGSDTFFALATLKLLKFPFRDQKTVLFLKSRQSEDGSFESIFAAYYAIKGLALLDEEPIYDAVPYILSHVRIHHIDRLPAEVPSIFQSLHLLSGICATLGITVEEDWKNEIVRFVTEYQNSDGGFGHPRSNLAETVQGLEILKWLSYPIETQVVKDFIVKCESPIYGFVDVPGMSPSFLEHVQAGVCASRLLGYEPLYPERCVEFLRDCQNGTGGFSRATHAGIATLENTYRAVQSLSLLSVLNDM